MYQQHMTPEVQKIMEGYRIGDLVSSGRLERLAAVVTVNLLRFPRYNNPAPVAGFSGM